MYKLNKGETVYTILRGVSRSGMTRYFDCYIIRTNDLIKISDQVAETLGRTYHYKTYPFGIICRGSGMDMAFELVYSYSQKLFRDGYLLKQRAI